MKVKHILAVAALTLLVGQQVNAQGYDYGLSKITLKLINTNESDSDSRDIKDGYIEKTKFVTLKIGSKQILEMFVENEAIPSIRGYWLVIQSYHESIYDIYAVNKDGDFVSAVEEDIIDLFIERDFNDSQGAIYQGTYKSQGGREYDYEKTTDKYTLLRTATLQFNFYGGSQAELTGIFKSNHFSKFDSNREINESYLQGASLSGSGSFYSRFEWEDLEEMWYDDEYLAGDIKISKATYDDIIGDYDR